MILQLITRKYKPGTNRLFLFPGQTGKDKTETGDDGELAYRLTQLNYAKLTHRNISSFKRDFRLAFGTTLNKKLTEMRLKYAPMGLATPEENINEVVCAG